MKHIALKIGDLFKIDGQFCRKSSQIGYVKLNEAMMGEVQFSFEDDAKIEFIVPETKPAEVVAQVVALAVKKPVAKKKPAKKAITAKVAKKAVTVRRGFVAITAPTKREAQKLMTKLVSKKQASKRK